MPLIHCDFSSKVLGFSTSIVVLLPLERTSTSVLTLLHGYSDDQTAWTRQTSVERYASRAGLTVVMPYLCKSFCTDMAHGDRYFTFITEELPQVTKSLFQLSDRREDNFIAGLSMGGYSAFKVALTYPERYAAAASLSGVLDINHSSMVGTPQFRDVFGVARVAETSPNHLFHLVRKLKASGTTFPRLHQSCGTEDFLYEGNQNFRQLLNKLGVEHTYLEETGDHNWEFWDRNIQRVIEWLK